MNFKRKVGTLLIVALFALVPVHVLGSQNKDVNTEVTSSWHQIGQDMDGQNRRNFFGRAIAMSSDGKVIAVGAHRATFAKKELGQVSTFSYDDKTSSWAQFGGDLDGDKPWGRFGESLAINHNGTMIVVGASAGQSGAYGYARVYIYGNNTWTQLGNSMNGLNSSDYTGASVAMSRDGYTIVIGPAYTGYMRVFAYDEKSKWKLRGQVIYCKKNLHKEASVAMSDDGNTFVVGLASVQVYTFDAGDDKWIERGPSIETCKNCVHEHGVSVAMTGKGNTIAIGESRKGTTRVFTYNSESFEWSQVGKTIEDLSYGYGGFGHSIAMTNDGKMLVVGSPNENAGGYGDSNSNLLVVYKYDSDFSSWLQFGQQLDGEESDDWLGSSVAISDDGMRVAAGAQLNDGGGKKSGHVRVYAQSCVDSPIMMSETRNISDKTRGCKWIAANKKRRCKNIGFRKHCPKTCNSPEFCTEDSTKKLELEESRVKITCFWVGRQFTKYRCSKTGISETCRRTCSQYV